MSRVEEKAEKVYPAWRNGIGDEFSQNSAYYGFIEGYHQAEKDLELGWEDINKIISIDQQVCGTMGISVYTYNHQQAMEEVLKRFKDYKK